MKKYDGEIMEMADEVEDALLVVRDAWKSVFAGYSMEFGSIAVAILAAALILKGVRDDGEEESEEVSG